MKVHDKSHFIFDDGRLLYANDHIIGINPDLQVHEGYDGDIDIGPWSENLSEREIREHFESIGLVYDEEYLSLSQMIEMADYMIGLWEQYKRKRQQALANNGMNGDRESAA